MTTKTEIQARLALSKDLDKVTPKKQPPKDLFATGTADAIFEWLKKAHPGSKAKASSALNFYINRAGDTLSAVRRSVLTRVKAMVSDWDPEVPALARLETLCSNDGMSTTTATAPDPEHALAEWAKAFGDYAPDWLDTAMKVAKPLFEQADTITLSAQNCILVFKGVKVSLPAKPHNRDFANRVFLSSVLGNGSTYQLSWSKLKKVDMDKISKQYAVIATAQRELENLLGATK